MTDQDNKIDLSIEQTRAWDYLDAPNKITQRVIYGGQAGGGKSFLISLWQIHRRLMYPGTRGYMAREVLKDLKNSLMVTFWDVQRMYWPNLKIRYNDQKSYIDFPNGSRIVLLEVKYRPSDPNFDDLGSTEYTDGAVEEGVNIHHRAAELLLSRTRYKHQDYGLTPKQLITLNPGEGWIKEEVVLPHFAGTIFKKNKFVPATLDSNPNTAFAIAYRKTLEGMSNPYDRARLLNGDWHAKLQTGGEFYKSFRPVAHVRDDDQVKYNSDLPLHITFDENVHPYITLCIWQGEGKSVVQIDEFCLKHPRNTVKQLCAAFADQYRNHITGLFVYGDSTSKKEDTKLEKGQNFYNLVTQYLKKFKPRQRVPGKNPPVAMRGNFINAILRNNFDDIEVLISATCKNTIEDYQQVKEDADGTKKKIKYRDPETKVTYEVHGHTSDANDYFLCEYFKESFTLYQRGPDEGKRVIQSRPTSNKY